MDLTIEKLLNLSSYKQAQVVSGHAGFKNIVTGITIMEDTTIKEWLKGGELLVTSLLPVKDLMNHQMIGFFDTLLDKNISGVIIKVGKHVDEIPKELIEWGDKNSMPMIKIPRHIPYTDIMYPTMSEILEKKVNELAYFKSAHDKFRDMSIKDYPIKKVLETLSNLIGNPVEIYDKNHNLILSTFREPISTRLQTDTSLITNKNQYKYYEIEIDGRGVKQIIVEISAVQDTKTYLSIIEWNKEVTEMEFLAIENACTTIALSMTKDIAIKEVEERFMNDLVSDLLFTGAKLEDTMLERANISGIDIFGDYFVVVLSFEFKVDSIKYDLKRKLGRLVKKYNGVYSLRNDNIIIFIKSDKNVKKKELLSLLKKDLNNINELLLENEIEVGFIGGIGRKAKGYNEFIKSYEQAIDAINIGKALDNKANIFDYDELGSFKLISDISKMNDINNYIPLSVISLIDIDKSKNSKLLKTLETYIKNNKHIKSTAKELFIHPKTVSYRLEQIRDLIGIDLEDANQLFEIQIGMKILSFLKNK